MPPDLSAPLDGLSRLRAAGHRIADEVTGKSLLRAAGVRVPRAEVVPGPGDAPEAAARVGLPVAVKLVCPDVAHKSHVGAVEGPLGDAAAVAGAAQRVWRRRTDAARGLLVEHWHEGGPLCFAGLAMHPAFGPVVAFGLGGVWVEVLRDVAFRLAPVSGEEALGMIRGLRGAPLLAAERTAGAGLLDGLAATIRTVSELACVQGVRDLVSQLDVNPLCPAEGGAVALDCSIVLH